ncbi:MAG TPA: hypothetical protein PKH39_02600 [Woeseiaceae bacterium]|nr:hypothetical protein [Woeseiaceae bacterium]
MASRPVLAAALLVLATPVISHAELPGLRADCAEYQERLRRRPGEAPRELRRCDEPGVIPAVWRDLPDFTAIPDRWRIVNAIGYRERLFDPYNGNNVLKGDRPAFGKDWFVALNFISDTTAEGRSLPTPAAISTTPDPDTLGIFGDPDQVAITQTFILETVLYKGETIFKPPDYEFRFLPVFSLTHVEVDQPGILRADSTLNTIRDDDFLGIQGLFVDKHLRNVSERYDFDSIRIGIQPITADFRGFLFQDSPVGIRLFGTRDNNRWQYNIGAFRRLEKNTNSGLNDISADLREDDVFLINLYRQDFPVLGFTSQIALLHNRNRETGAAFIDTNGFVDRPAALGIQKTREYDVSYLGFNGDGHFGRWNLTASAYYAFGEETPASFIDQPSDIRAAFAAVEVSRDFDWLRLRGSLVYGSGDDEPHDDRSNGFDAIFENPLIAGADTSFWIRQSLPLVGGGRVTLSSPNGLLNSLRPNKFNSQSNFSNPGLLLLGAGVDMEVTPKLRASININQLWFDDTAVLEVARNQGPVERTIGQDLSFSLTYRPLTSQNIVLRLAGSALLPGDGYRQLFGSDTAYSVLANVLLAY